MANKTGFLMTWLILISVILQGGKEYLMRAHFGLPSVEKEDQEGRPPIHIKFEIPYFTVSGIQVSQTRKGDHPYTSSLRSLTSLYLIYR